MLGVQSAEQRQALIDELYDYLREFFELTRQKEEKAIINKNKARRLALVRPAEVAAQILAEIKADHPELLRRYAPDFLNLNRSLDTYDLPAEGQPQELRDLYHDRGVVFMKGKKCIASIDTHMPEQDPLIILLAKSGIRGLVPIPHEKDECQSVLQEYGDFIRRREETVRGLIANRTLDEEMQEKISAALMPLIVQGNS